MNRWREYESAGPIPVEGGIKARSQRGAIGEQWWSRRFIAVLESYGMSGRLQRGRSYARRAPSASRPPSRARPSAPGAW